MLANRNAMSQHVIVSVRKSHKITNNFLATLSDKPHGHHWKGIGYSANVGQCPNAIHNLHLGNQTLPTGFDFYSTDDQMKNFAHKVKQGSKLFVTNDHFASNEGRCMIVQPVSMNLVSYEDEGQHKVMNVFHNKSQKCTRKTMDNFLSDQDEHVQFSECGDIQLDQSEYQCGCKYNFDMQYNCAHLIERISSSKVSTLAKNENLKSNNSWFINEDEAVVSAYVLNTRARFSNDYYELLTYYFIIILGFLHSMIRLDQKTFKDGSLACDVLQSWSVQNIMFNNPGNAVTHWKSVFQYVDLATWLFIMTIVYTCQWFETLRIAWYIFYIKCTVDVVFYTILGSIIGCVCFYLFWQFVGCNVLPIYRARTKNKAKVTTFEPILNCELFYCFNLWSFCCFKIITHIAQWLFVIKLMDTRIFGLLNIVISNYYTSACDFICLAIAAIIAIVNVHFFVNKMYHNADFTGMSKGKVNISIAVSWSVPVMRLFGFFTYKSQERLWLSSFFHEGFMFHNGHITIYVQCVICFFVCFFEHMDKIEEDGRKANRVQP